MIDCGRVRKVMDIWNQEQVWLEEIGWKLYTSNEVHSSLIDMSGVITGILEGCPAYSLVKGAYQQIMKLSDLEDLEPSLFLDFTIEGRADQGVNLQIHYTS